MEAQKMRHRETESKRERQSGGTVTNNIVEIIMCVVPSSNTPMPKRHGGGICVSNYPRFHSEWYLKKLILEVQCTIHVSKYLPMWVPFGDTIRNN